MTDDIELIEIDSDMDDEDAVPTGQDEVPDVREDAVEDDPTVPQEPPTED